MADGTHIEWTDATWNPITGCAIVSKGCTNCYAMKLAGTRMRHHPSRAGLTKETKAGPVWTGEVRFNEQWLDQPLRWNAPRRIFVCAHGDLFAEGVPDAWIDRVFAVMALAPQHTFQVLTKRPERMRAYLTGSGLKPRGFLGDGASVRFADIAIQAKALGGQRMPLLPLPNVWLGISAEDQATADARIPELLAAPAAVRFVSAEPLLGRIDFVRPFDLPGGDDECFPLGIPPERIDELDGPPPPRIDWIIVGGESGPGARPMHPDWSRSIRDQCQAAGVAFFFKQWGAWVSTYDRDQDDPDWRRVPKAGDWDRKRFLNLAGGQGFHGDRLQLMRNVGKAVAGRLLDGREWSEFPEVRS